MKIFRRSIFFTIIILIMAVLYSIFIEPKLLVVKDYGVVIDRGREIKVIQFTDTHLGEFYSLEQLKKAVKKINSLNPDIVVFTGDLIDNAYKYEEKNKISEVLKEINASIGKYAIYGNHDYGGGAVRYYRTIIEKSGFKVLRNSKETINIGNKKINIFGVDDKLLGNFSVDKTMNGINKKDINLLLLHEPDLIDKFKSYPIDLALSGHSHGGQVYVPFYGPIVKNVLAEKYNKGFYEINNSRFTKLYVNTGMGNTKLPFRFFNIPEISMFKIAI